MFFLHRFLSLFRFILTFFSFQIGTKKGTFGTKNAFSHFIQKQQHQSMLFLISEEVAEKRRYSLKF
ncbi:hypothetical protein ADH67_11840 [Turicimonas muris]|uniref:Uncharacterized protein n=1 Tax=Turicimonas muris TaxID=1796652 RepID=A0A227KCG7_9BURK|nr:hypothetical protein ADH67_11840 [Turicimonas muris]